MSIFMPGGDSPELVKLVLWRHGQTTYNAERRFQGQSDVPLNATGLDQAAEAAPYLAALRPDAIFSSDLSRASETAGFLARLTGLPVQLEKDLRERGGGSWEGLTSAEIQDRFPAEYASWAPPDGESAEAVADRGEAAMRRIAESLPGGGLAVVVGHGGSLGFGVARLLGISDDLRALGPFGNCRWSVVSRRMGKWRLLEHNAGVLAEPVLEAEAVPDAEPVVESPAGPVADAVRDVDAEREE